MQALILAAGRGSRLGKITEGAPKCLLQVGGRPIVAHQLEALAEAGVGPVGMVVGYCADEIRRAVGIGVEYIDNPRWNATNSLYSFWLARDWVKGSLVVLNSDVTFHPEILHRVLAAGGDAIAYDSSSAHAPEHMKVRVVDGQLIDMSKDMDAGVSTGENVGILCFSDETVKLLFRKADTLLASGSERDWIGTAVRQVARERKIQAVDIAGIPWVEIDCAHDLQRARREIWPAIRSSGSRLRRIGRFVMLAALLCLIVAISALGIWDIRSDRAKDWEVVELCDVPTITINAGDRKQTWWILKKDAIIAESVSGPGKVRVDSRLLLESGTEQKVPYVLSIELDGDLIDWFKENGEQSETWSHAEWAVSKLASVDIELPAGSHTLRIAFMSTVESPACAVRLRQPGLGDPD